MVWVFGGYAVPIYTSHELTLALYCALASPLFRYAGAGYGLRERAGLLDREIHSCMALATPPPFTHHTSSYWHCTVRWRPLCLGLPSSRVASYEFLCCNLLVS